MTLSKTIATLVSATAALSLLPALAATSTTQVKTEDVSVKGYDLAETTDANQIFAKIEQAAERVCTISGVHDGPREKVLRRACASEAIANAVAALNAPEVTALMREKTNQ